VDFAYMAIVIGAHAAAFFYFTPLKSAGGITGQGDNYKFEIKKAKDME